MPTFALVFKVAPEVQARAIWQEKEIKGLSIRKKKKVNVSICKWQNFL
jgi:predicted GIY-YIG superfamily endonuclease